MSMSISVPVQADKPSIVIIDSKKLRLASLMQLLQSWADALGLTLNAIPSERSAEVVGLDANCEMVILSIGSDSLEDPRQQASIKCMRTRMPHASVVIISDREEAAQIRAAFEAGAVGFMPTSVEPSMALQALSFIKGGGSYFPPSALAQSGTPSVACEEALSETHWANHEYHQLKGHGWKLSAKQEQVFELLRDGPSNKVIARRLGLSEATVKVHIRCIMRKLGVVNRTQLAIVAMNGNLAENSKELKSERLGAETLAG